MRVLPFNRTETQTAATYTLFGKLPNRADFVRVDANHPVALEFDELIQSALEQMAGEAGVLDGAETSGTVDFFYVSKDQRQIMLGVLMPSQDQAGRRYPLVAAVILPYDSIEGYLPVAPIAYEVFFDGLRDQVANAVENSVEALSCRLFLESNLHTYETAEDDLELAQSVVDRFMSMQPVSRVGNLLREAPFQASLQQTLLNIAFYQAHLRRFDNRATNQLFLLPLSGNKGEQCLIASAWLTILSALWWETESGHSWRGSYLFLRRSDEGAQLVASIGKIPASFSKVILGGDVTAPMVLELGAENEAWMSHRMYAEASYALGRILADPECRLAELCTFLGDVSRELERNI